MMTKEQKARIRETLGPQLAAIANKHGNFYVQFERGLMKEAVGGICAGMDHGYIRKVRRRLDALRAELAL